MTTQPTGTRQIAKEVLELERAIKALQSAIQRLKGQFTGDDIEIYFALKQTSNQES